MVFPQISVIIPVHQTDPRMFEHCLHSLGMQDIESDDLEVIVVFDGPQNASLYELCTRYSSKCRLIRVDSVGKGVSAARNTGIDKATGEWLSFVDSDDFVPQSALQLLLHYAVSNQCDIVMGSHISVLGHGKEYHNYHDSEEVLEGGETQAFCRDVLRPQTNAGLVWGKLYRSSLIKGQNIRFNEAIAVAEDSDFVFRAAAHSRRIGYIRQTVYQYNRNAGSAVRAFREDYVERIVKSMDVMRLNLSSVSNGENLLPDFECYVAFHLLLILVNYLFNPQSSWSEKERRAQYRAVLSLPVFAECLQKVDLSQFSLTRRISLISMRYRWYSLSKAIGFVRQQQLK